MTVRLRRLNRGNSVVVKFRLMDRAPKAESSEDSPITGRTAAALYCPVCAVQVDDPLTCGDCSSVICRRCGTPLESSDELGMG